MMPIILAYDISALFSNKIFLFGFGVLVLIIGYTLARQFGWGKKIKETVDGTEEKINEIPVIENDLEYAKSSLRNGETGQMMGGIVKGWPGLTKKTYFTGRLELEDGTKIDINSNQIEAKPSMKALVKGEGHEWLFYPNGNPKVAREVEMQREIDNKEAMMITKNEDIKRLHLSAREQLKLIRGEIGATRRESTPLGQSEMRYMGKGKDGDDEKDYWDED